MPVEKLCPADSIWRRKWFQILFGLSLACAVGAPLLRAWIGSRDQNIFWQEFLLGDLPLALILPFLCVAAAILSRFAAQGNGRALAQIVERNIAWLCAASVVFYLSIGSVTAWGHAYAPDEAGALLQARTFAAFHLTPRVAPELLPWIVPPQLQGDLILTSRQSGFYSPTYWPGFALLLAPFAFLGLEWLCNPVLTALSLLLLFHITRRLTGSGEAGVWAVVFGFCSAQIALGAATFFSMPAHLLASLLFCWFWIQNTRRGAFWAGIVGGFALVLHNPVPHFSFALPWILWMMRHRRAHLGPLLLGYVILALPLGLGWSAHLQGFDAGRYALASTKTAPFMEIVSRVAFVLRPPDSYLLLSRGAALIKTVVWACPGLIGLAFLGWRESNRMRRQGSDLNATYLWLLGASVVCNFALYLLIRFDQGHGWGFRYLHQSYGAFPILAALWMTRIRGAASENGLAKRFGAVSCALGLLVLPLFVLQARLFSQTVAHDQPPAPPAGASITFLRLKGEAETFLRNDPFLRNQDWKLRFVFGAQNEKLARRYLLSARRVQSGKWGEMWSGSGFLIPPSPDSK